MPYDKAVRMMQTGDVMAFGGEGFIVNRIESFTDSDQAHVGTIIRPDVGDEMLLSEARPSGMTLSFLWEVFKEWEDVWYLPLKLLNIQAMSELVDINMKVCRQNIGYDFKAIYRYWRKKSVPENYSKLYCSEIVALGWRKAGIYDGTTSLTPVQVCRTALYASKYYCLKWAGSKPKEIPNFNTVEPMLLNVKANAMLMMSGPDITKPWWGEL
jgi:hypothetical protein